MFIVYILGFIFMLGLVIFIHELGHFIMAKRAGILCHEFALGMGPIIYSKKKGETLYSIRAIPIGGFVSMAGEEMTEDFVKVGNQIKVLFSKSNNRVITHLILDKDDNRYKDAETVMVEVVDLEGKEGKALRLNEYEVKRDAYYVMKDKEIQIAPYDRSFDSKTLLERFLTIFAGPFMNFLLAFILFTSIAFLVGLPQFSDTEIGAVSSRAEIAGIEVGDELVSINDRAIEHWDDIAPAMRLYAGDQTITFTVKRDNALYDLAVTPVIQFYNVGFSSDPEVLDAVVIGSVGEGAPSTQATIVSGDTEVESLLKGDEIVRIGYATSMLTDVDSWNDVVSFMRDNASGDDTIIEVNRDGEIIQYMVGPFSARFLEGQGISAISAVVGIGPNYEREFFGSFRYGMGEVATTMGMIFSTLRALFAESRVGVGDLAGPVGIASITANFIDLGIIAFVSWIAILSVNLGIINLLPIPALDGGRIVFLGYEAVARRKVNKRVENTLHFVMFVLLITLFVFITFNDILRLFNIG